MRPGGQIDYRPDDAVPLTTFCSKRSCDGKGVNAWSEKGVGSCGGNGCARAERNYCCTSAAGMSISFLGSLG